MKQTRRTRDQQGLFDKLSFSLPLETIEGDGSLRVLKLLPVSKLWTWNLVQKIDLLFSPFQSRCGQ